MKFEYEADEQKMKEIAYKIIDKSYEVNDTALHNKLHSLGRKMLEDARKGGSNTVRTSLIDL